MIPLWMATFRMRICEVQPNIKMLALRYIQLNKNPQRQQFLLAIPDCLRDSMCERRVSLISPANLVRIAGYIELLDLAKNRDCFT